MAYKSTFKNKTTRGGEILNGLRHKVLDCRALWARNDNTVRGRSMLEMLGVLAVIGILSGLALFGYNIAMTYHRANETIHDVMIRGTNVPMIWEDYATYLDPHEFDFSELGNTFKTTNALGYPVKTYAEPDSSAYIFRVEVSDIPQKVCERLLSMRPTSVDLVEAPADLYKRGTSNSLESACTVDFGQMNFYFDEDWTPQSPNPDDPNPDDPNPDSPTPNPNPTPDPATCTCGVQPECSHQSGTVTLNCNNGTTKQCPVYVSDMTQKTSGTCCNGVVSECCSLTENCDCAMEESCPCECEEKPVGCYASAGTFAKTCANGTQLTCDIWELRALSSKASGECCDEAPEECCPLTETCSCTAAADCPCECPEQPACSEAGESYSIICADGTTKSCTNWISQMSSKASGECCDEAPEECCPLTETCSCTAAADCPCESNKKTVATGECCDGPYIECCPTEDDDCTCTKAPSCCPTPEPICGECEIESTDEDGCKICIRNPEDLCCGVSCNICETCDSDTGNCVPIEEECCGKTGAALECCLNGLECGECETPNYETCSCDFDSEANCCMLYGEALECCKSGKTCKGLCSVPDWESCSCDVQFGCLWCPTKKAGSYEGECPDTLGNIAAMTIECCRVCNASDSPYHSASTYTPESGEKTCCYGRPFKNKNKNEECCPTGKSVTPALGKNYEFCCIPKTTASEEGCCTPWEGYTWYGYELDAVSVTIGNETFSKCCPVGNTLLARPSGESYSTECCSGKVYTDSDDVQQCCTAYDYQGIGAKPQIVKIKGTNINKCCQSMQGTDCEFDYQTGQQTCKGTTPLGGAWITSSGYSECCYGTLYEEVPGSGNWSCCTGDNIVSDITDNRSRIKKVCCPKGQTSGYGSYDWSTVFCCAADRIFKQGRKDIDTPYQECCAEGNYIVPALGQNYEECCTQNVTASEEGCCYPDSNTGETRIAKSVVYEGVTYTKCCFEDEPLFARKNSGSVYVSCCAGTVFTDSEGEQQCCNQAGYAGSGCTLTPNKIVPNVGRQGSSCCGVLDISFNYDNGGGMSCTSYADEIQGAYVGSYGMTCCRGRITETTEERYECCPTSTPKLIWEGYQTKCCRDDQNKAYPNLSAGGGELQCCDNQYEVVSAHTGSSHSYCCNPGDSGYIYYHSANYIAGGCCPSSAVLCESGDTSWVGSRVCCKTGCGENGVHCNSDGTAGYRL